MKKLGMLWLGMILALGLFIISCGETGPDDSTVNPAISEQSSGYDSATSEQIAGIPKVNTIITSAPPKEDCSEVATFQFTCNRMQACKQLALPKSLWALIKPYCACSYECKVYFEYPIAIQESNSIPEGWWYSCSSPEEIVMPGPYVQATFWVRATDILGNVDRTPAKYEWGNYCPVD